MSRPKWPDWQGRLAATIDAAVGKAWAWGEHDCCAFVVKCLKAQWTGLSLPAGMGAYLDDALGDAEPAAVLLRRWDGVEGIADEVARINGAGTVAPVLAQRGDIVLVKTETNEPALGVVDTSGTRVAVAADGGLSFQPLGTDLILKAWRI